MKKHAEAMVLTDFSQPLKLEKYPIPDVGPGEVLVRVTAAGVCGSDVHMWQGHDERTPRPMILGHEGAGEIAKIGGAKSSVLGKKLEPKQKVLWNRGVICGKCYFCTVAQQPYLCPNRWVYGIHRSCENAPHLRGCYAEYLLLDANTDILLLEDVQDDDVPVMVSASCSGATAANAIELCPTRQGDTVLVQGPGPLGVFLTAFARASGAGRIIVVGGTESRLEFCREMGATMLLNRRATTVEERREAILDSTQGRGVDVAYEAAGTGEAVREGINLVRHGGQYALVGFGQPGGKVTLDCFSDLVRKNLHLQGVWVSHTRHTFQAIQLILQDREKFRRLVTHQFPLRQATEALETMMGKEALKAVLLP